MLVARPTAAQRQAECAPQALTRAQQDLIPWQSRQEVLRTWDLLQRYKWASQHQSG